MYSGAAVYLLLITLNHVRGDNMETITSWVEDLHGKHFNPTDLIAIVSESAYSVDSFIENEIFVTGNSFSDYFSYFVTNFKHPRVVYNCDATYYPLEDFEKPNLYVIFIQFSERSFVEGIMDFLHGLDNWFPQAKFIVICQEQEAQLDVVIEIFYKHYVFDVVIVSNDMEFFTYEPYALENLYEPDLSIVKLGSVPDDNVFYEKRPLLWRNSSAVVTPVSLKPYVISIEGRTGIDMNLMEVLGEKLGLTLLYDPEPHYDWGWRHSNGTYGGVFRILQLGKTDFVNGHFHFRDPASLIDFDFTFSYTEDPLIWVVPCPVPITNVTGLIHIFAAHTWYSVLTVLAVSLVVWQLIGRVIERGRYFSTWYSLEVPFLLFLGLSLPIGPKKEATKIMYLSSWIFGFIMSSSWLSNLTASLTHVTYEKPIKSVPEIWERGLILGIHPELAAMYGESGDEVGAYILEHFYECDLSGGRWDRVAYQRNMATITTARILRYITYDRYMSAKGEQLMVVVEDVHVNMDYTVMYFVKGHPMCGRVSELLMRIREGGFINYFDVHINYKQAITNRRELFNPNQMETKMLNMEQMMAPFLLLVVGLPIATVAFFCELCKRRAAAGRRRQLAKHVK